MTEDDSQSSFVVVKSPEVESKIEGNTAVPGEGMVGIKVFQGSIPHVIIRQVEDWELDMLTDGEQSDVKTFAFTFLGIFFGFLQNAISVVQDFENKKLPSLIDLVGGAICIAVFFVSVTCFTISSGKRSAALEQKRKIRERPVSSIS